MLTTLKNRQKSRLRLPYSDSPGMRIVSRSNGGTASPPVETPAPPAAPGKPKAKKRDAAVPRSNVQRDTSLTLSGLATIYGCCGLFDLCGDSDLMSLSFEGMSQFLDWIGWERTDVCRIRKNFITFTRPEYEGGNATSGVVANPCDDPNGVEWGTCDFTLEDFARLRREGPTREITKGGVRLCEAQPRYRLDGSPITDDREYDMRVTTEVLLQDLKRIIVTGNKSNDGEADGLENLVITDYVNSSGRHCSIMDSIVVDWNANDLDGGAGITWNGAAVGATYSFFDVLMAVYRRIRQRLGWSPTLDAQNMQPGDMVLVLPEAYVDCILNAFTCWRVCPGQAFNENNLLSLEARTFRNNLNGGMFGAGKIFLHGFEVPILPYDWGLIKGPTRFDAYLLTGTVGTIKLIQGQYNDMSYAASRRPDRYAATDGGRLLTYSQDDHTCERRIVEMEPRLLMWAPWAQARFIDLKCAVPGGVISPDPTETSFFPESSFSVAECP